MTEQEIQEIYNRLLELTKNRAITWKKNRAAEYTVNFSRSSVAIGRDYELDGAPPALKVFNAEGILVGYAADELPDYLGEGVKSFSLDVSELFELVTDEVHKYSETTKNILDELREIDHQLKEARP